MQTLLRLFFVLFGLLTMLAQSGCGRSSADAPAKPAAPLAVQLARAKHGDATRSITLPAEVRAYQQAMLYAKVGGYVKAVAADKGDSVKEGALLADIEVPELIADRAKFAAELEVAQIEFKRVSEAQQKASDLVVPQAVDNAKSKFDIAKANLERTDTLLGFAKITAPFAGTVTKRMVDPGAFIPAATSGSAAQNAALFMLMDFSKVRVQTAIPENEVPFIKNGLPVKITVEELPGHPFEGTVTRYAQALDDATKTMLAEVELPNPQGELRPGMYAIARIIVERKPDALLIPSNALVVEKTRNSAFTVAEGKAKRVTIKTGFNDGGWVEVLEGLKLDDTVISDGKQVLNDGQAVSVTEGK